MQDQPLRPALSQRTRNLPEALRAYLSQGDAEILCGQFEWEVEIEEPPPWLARRLPSGAVLIAGNGGGDHLFLLPSTSDPVQLGPKVYVCWHDEPQIDVLAEDINSLLTDQPLAARIAAPVLYPDGRTRVQLGDEVTARRFVRRQAGRVVYVPGISKRNRTMEHEGLYWVGIELANRTRIRSLVDSVAFRVKRSIHFLKRSSEPFQEISPQVRLD